MMKYFDDMEFLVHGEIARCAGIWDGYFQDYYGLQYTHSGKIELTVDSGPVQSAEGPALFVSEPGPHFRYRPPEGETRHHVFLCFRGTRVTRWMKEDLLPPPGKLFRLTSGNEVLAAMRRIFHLTDLPGGRGRDRAVLETEQMLLLWIRATPPSARMPVRIAPRFDELAAQLRNRPELEWNFEREAADAEMSYSHFRLLFRERFGCPPGRYLVECRVNKAAELLLHSNLQIREIALKCGFVNEFYFSRIFHQYRRMTPSAYRL